MGGEDAAGDVAGDAVPASDESGATDAAVVRGRILRRFEAWLDEVLTDEQPPQGLDAEILARLEGGAGAMSTAAAQQGGDLFSLWSAMVALTQETKLQGRAFKQLREGLSPVEALPGSIQDVLSASQEALSVAGEATRQTRELQAQQVRQAAAEARQEAEAKAVGVLLDIRDRLVRGAQTARGLLGGPEVDKVDGADGMDRTAKPGWLARLFGARAPSGRGAPDRSAAQAARAMLEGYLLSLDRMEEALAAMGISEIPCQGQPFDPRRMSAVAVEQTADVAEGTVVDVYRSGYEWNGRVHRPAEVKVARRLTGA